jgi:hypothetical protein
MKGSQLNMFQQLLASASNQLRFERGQFKSVSRFGRCAFMFHRSIADLFGLSQKNAFRDRPLFFQAPDGFGRALDSLLFSAVDNDGDWCAPCESAHSDSPLSSGGVIQTIALAFCSKNPVRKFPLQKRKQLGGEIQAI